MSDSVKDQLAKSALVVDTQSVYTAYSPQRVDYTEVLNFLSTGFELVYAVAHSNYFDGMFADYLYNLRIDVKPRKSGHVFELVKDCVKLAESYETIILFTEEHYVRYLKEEVNKKGSYLHHMGRGADIDLPENIFRRKV